MKKWSVQSNKSLQAPYKFTTNPLLLNGYGTLHANKNIKSFSSYYSKKQTQYHKTTKKKKSCIWPPMTEFCILQKEEKLRHLFFKCSFVRNCWSQIGVVVPTWLKPKRAKRHIKRSFRIPFIMKIIIIMCWCIWTERNAWLFNNEDSRIIKCIDHFKKEFDLIIHRSKSSQSSRDEIMTM
jgi:hypothetical protein